MTLFKVVIIALGLAFSLMLLFFVWPTQYKVLPVKTIRDEQFQQRQNRVTGVVETWIPKDKDRIGGKYIKESGVWTEEL